MKRPKKTAFAPEYKGPRISVPLDIWVATQKDVARWDYCVRNCKRPPFEFIASVDKAIIDEQEEKQRAIASNPLVQ